MLDTGNDIAEDCRAPSAYKEHCVGSTWYIALLITLLVLAMLAGAAYAFKKHREAAGGETTADSQRKLSRIQEESGSFSEGGDKGYQLLKT